jgi:hypothetical protein
VETPESDISESVTTILNTCFDFLYGFGIDMKPRQQCWFSKKYFGEITVRATPLQYNI